MLSITGVQDTMQSTVESTEDTVALDSICSTSEGSDPREYTATKEKNNPDPTTKTNPGEISGSSDQRREKVKRFNPSTRRTDVRGFFSLDGDGGKQWRWHDLGG